MHVLGADMITINKIINLMCLAQKMHFLKDMFQMTAILLVSVINHCHINGLHLFCDTLGSLNIHGTHVTANNSTNNNVVFFFISDLKIVCYDS